MLVCQCLSPAEIISEEERKNNRKDIRKKYGIGSDDILFVHSGKMGKLKRTIELLQHFSRNSNSGFRLIIAGSIEEEIKKEVCELIDNDPRVKYIGFISGDELTKLLCACDLYLQPGTISQTSQTAICCGSPIMFMRCPTNEELYNGNGFILDNLEQMDMVFESIDNNSAQLNGMKEKSIQLAQERLEYMKLFNDTLKYAGVKF